MLALTGDYGDVLLLLLLMMMMMMMMIMMIMLGVIVRVVNYDQAHSLPTELVTKVLGTAVYVGPIVTIEPRRRKFHKPITVTLPLPWELQSTTTKYNINSLRLLCSIAGIS